MSQHEQPAPLSGIRVVEVANYVAAPSAGATLRDLGADVLKVEPPGGEVMRGVIPREPNFLFDLENRGKRSVAIDLAHPEGAEVVHTLLEGADVLLTNLLPKRLDRFGLSPAVVRDRHPRLIYCSITGYGIEGPEADRLAFDFAAFWTRSGIMSLVGHPDAPPVLSRVAQGDHATGINAVAAILAALRLRDLTGEGQLVEVTLQRTGMFTIATDIARTLSTGKQPPRFDRTRPENPLFNTYETADGQWLLLVHMTPDPYWPKLCAALERPDLAAEAAYTTMDSRRTHGAALFETLQATFREHGLAHWAARLDEHGLIWAPMTELPEVVADPELRVQGAIQTVPNPAGDYETMGPPFAIRGADMGIRGRSPQPGEHTFEALREAGLDDDQIASLAAQGIFG